MKKLGIPLGVTLVLYNVEKALPKLPTFIPFSIQGEYITDRELMSQTSVIPGKIIVGTEHQVYLEILVLILEYASILLILIKIL